jgi:hypothetical protein
LSIPTAFIQSLRSTLPKHEPEYQRVREREPILAVWSTALELFDGLAKQSKLDAGARTPLLRVVVLEYQVRRHPLWHALAVCALQPLLGGLGGELRRLDTDDREQALHAAFIQALGTLRLGEAGKPFPFLTLRRSIERALISMERTERELGDGEVPFDEEAEACAPAPHEEPQPYLQCLAHEVSELVAREHGGEDVVRVLAGVETLPEQAERLAATEVSYDCLQKRHRRALDGIRHELGTRTTRGHRRED